jgi:glucose/arabinose dehydrogenase
MKTHFLLFPLFLGGFTSLFAAQGPEPVESEYYKITTFPTPPGTALEVGAVEFLPEGKIALGTRRGEVWLVDNAQKSQVEGQWNAASNQFEAVSGGVSDLRYQRFAEGQHEVLGLAWKGGWLYVTNRYELLRMKDERGKGTATQFETIFDGWGVNGNYHEYTFGSRFDKNGDLWALCCLTGSGASSSRFRGWALRIKPDGTMTPTCSGIRSPGGVGFDADGEVYSTDNQGPWHGACTLQHLVPGTFQGHPAGNKWYDLAPNMGPRPVDPTDKSRMVVERERVKELVPPAVYMVHGKIGNSSSAIVCDLSEGRFGPFPKQLFVTDQSHSNISRVFLETVNGVKQGVVIPFLKGLKSGPIGARMGADGKFFVGGSDRGWGARGGHPFAFERVDWTGKVPFEIHEVHAKPDGFELTFTEALDPNTAANPESYKVREFTYIYQSAYGSPEVDEVSPKIEKIDVAADCKSVRLKLDTLTKGHVHELHVDGLRSRSGLPVLHPVAYYTLNEIPSK